MRRLIAYITTALAMLLAIGVSITPVLTKQNFGREFTQGREIIFNISAKDDADLPENAAEDVASEMRTRLDNFNIEDYSVKVQGNDTITASFAVEQDQFNYVAKYLEFTAESYSISGEDPVTTRGGLEKELFDMDNARIEYLQDTIPVVVVPVTKDGVTEIESIIKIINPSEEGEDGSGQLSHRLKADDDGHDHDHDHDHEGEEGGEGEQTGPTADMYLWVNWEEGDSYDLATKDVLVREKILMSFQSSNIWYENSKDDAKELAFMCATATEDNQLDLSGLKNDNIRANYMLNMLKANTYEVSVNCPTKNVTSAGVDYYTNSSEVTPSLESLITLGNNINVALSTTLIATLVAFVIVSLLLIVYYRINSIAMIATTLATLFVTLLSNLSMKVLFNIPALIGLLVLAGGTLLGEIVYANHFKEEVYKGRTVKKANQEASKKSNIVTLDVSIILAFSGLMMYVLGGTALKPLGVVLFFGAIFALLMNLIVFKILMYFVTHSTNLQSKYSAFNIEASKVPNLMSGSDEKPSYESPYENVDFTKRRKISSIVLGALAIAAVSVITVFGVIDGSPLNVKDATKDSTVIYTQLRSEGSFIQNESDFKEYVLKDLTLEDGSTIAEAKTVEMKNVVVEEYEADNVETNEYIYFICKLDASYNDSKLSDVEEVINSKLGDYGISESVVSVRNSKELIYTPDQGLVALATGISIVGVALYFAFRFRPSRAISVLVSTGGATAIAYGVIVATRIGTTAVTSLAMPVVALSMMLASLFYLTTERALRKETHEELTPEIKKSLMVKALSRSAAPMLVFMLITIYISINFFGFGLPQTAYLFGAALLGDIVAVIALLTIVGPFAHQIDKLLSKIHLPKIKFFAKKQNDNNQHKHNSSEPEETIFIGIND